MEIIAGEVIAGNKKSVRVRHQGNTIDFVTVNLTIPDPREDFTAVVGAINAFWGTLPLESQNKLFELYQEAHEIMEYVGEHLILHEQLSKVSCAIVDFYTYESVHYYMLKNRPVHIPDDLKMFYDELSPDNSRTYLLDDYLHLVTFSVILKSMIPIWGEYIQIIANSVGSEFKESRAAAMIKSSALMRSSPAKRLERYVEAYADTDTLNLPAVLGNMSSVDFPDYLRTLTIVRRLATCRLPGNAACPSDAPTHLIRDIYGFLKSKVNNADTLFTKSTVRDKSPESGDRSGGDEDNTSKIELIKLREEVDKGAVERYRLDALNAEWLYHRIDHTAPLDLLQLCQTEISSKLHLASDAFRIWIVRRVICGFRVMNPHPDIRLDLLEHGLATAFGDTMIKSKIFGAIVTDYLELPERISLMAVTQALLFHWGYPDIAALISSTRTVQPVGSFMSVQVAPIDGKLVELCFETYPYLALSPAAKVEYGKLQIEAQRSQKGQSQFYRLKVANNPLITNVNAYVLDLNKYTWVLHVPQQLRSRINFRKQENKWVIPEDLKNQLVSLVLKSKRG
jgi:hypothetical protein